MATKVNSNTQVKNLPQLSSTTYNFVAQTPGGALTAAQSNTITLSPVPLGVNGSNTSHYLYITGGTGTAEAVLITGGTAVAGSVTGTLTFTPANAHSGAWTIQSASAGIQEAIRSVTVASGYAAAPSVHVPRGIWPIYGTITNDVYASIIGEGTNSTILQKAFAGGDLIYVGDATTTLSGIGGIIRDLQIQPLTGVTDTSGNAIRVRYRYGYTIQNVTIYGDGGIGRIKNGIKFDSCLTFSLLNTRILNVTGTGLELATTGADQTTGRISIVDVTSPGTTNDLVNFTGTILSMSIDGLQMQGGFRNWHIDTTGGQFSESQINNVVFDSATNTAFSLAGTGSVFKLDFTNIELSTIAGVPSTVGMSFDGTGAAVFTQITITGLTGGVNASNQIGTALIVISATNFLLGNAQIQGAGGGVGDTAVQIAGTTNNVILTGTSIGYAYDGSTTGSQAYRGVYVPSGTHKNLTIDASNRIYGGTASISIAGAHTALYVAARLEGGAASFTGTGTYQFDYKGYVPSETGATNAIVGALAGVPLLTGVKLDVLLAHTLQAGANTFNFNGTGVKNIKSSRNPANNIAVAYATGGVVTLTYDGTEWLDMSQ